MPKNKVSATNAPFIISNLMLFQYFEAEDSLNVNKNH